MQNCLALSNLIARHHCADAIKNLATPSAGIVSYIALIGAVALFATIAKRYL